jgi:UPF0716 family protein affecting phage T7 exclusion
MNLADMIGMVLFLIIVIMGFVFSFFLLRHKR